MQTCKTRGRFWQNRSPHPPHPGLLRAGGWGVPAAARPRAPQLEPGSAPPGFAGVYVRAPPCQTRAGQEPKSKPCILHVTQETRDRKSRFLTVPLGLPPIDTFTHREV
ncbi:hypothetical protein MC885_010275 [Smutsia gigantea]|nr:hypothetical protein MC885_010275 [Smutsia gigantea]